MQEKVYQCGACLFVFDSFSSKKIEKKSNQIQDANGKN
jgi:hypothetical protein